VLERIKYMVKNSSVNFKKRTRRSRVQILKLKKHPRVSVYRSAKHIYAQIIDDEKGITLVSFSDAKLKLAKGKKVNKSEKAFMVGKELAGLAVKKKISKVIFDRGGYKYHGRVKSLAEGAREGGLKF
jgi:large subunit ribosomal protein L18